MGSSLVREYLHDVYGDTVPHNIVHDKHMTQLDFLYWSAPVLGRPIDIWLSTSWHDIGKHAKAGDGFLHMYTPLGFFVVPARKLPAVVVTRPGHHIAEVIRRAPRAAPGCCLENDANGVWYYTARGSGFWLELGRVLDCTGEAWVYHPGCYRNESFDTRLRHPPVVMLHAQEMGHAWRNATSGLFRDHFEIVDTRPYGTPSCSKEWCQGQKGVPEKGARGRNNTTPRLACGGSCPDQLSPMSKCSASSTNILTGWNATGAQCAECINSEEHLNCGLRHPPSVAHAKSYRRFTWAGGPPIHGFCLHEQTHEQNSSAMSTLSATSISAFVDVALNHEPRCEFARFRWGGSDSEAEGASSAGSTLLPQSMLLF